ncbi:hypothetical protein BDR22DRAFT_827338 [Usnea florida]
MFLDLDVVFFGGVLRGCFCVSWRVRTFFFDAERSLGTSWSCSRPGHAVIYLNAEEVVLGPTPFPNMCRTMLHEMCHACEIARVGANDGHNHDLEFGTKIHAVDRRARASTLDSQYDMVAVALMIWLATRTVFLDQGLSHRKPMPRDG